MFNRIPTFLILAAVLSAGGHPAPGQSAGRGRVGVRDLIIVMPDHPLHVRIEVLEGGRSLEEVRASYIEHLQQTLDVNEDGRLSRAESRRSPLFNTRRQFDNNPFLEKLERDSVVSQRDMERAVTSAAGQPLTFRQDDSLADNDAGVFEILDEDGSGMIEPDEMRIAASRIAARDSDTDRCITLDEFLDQPEPVEMEDPALMVEDTTPPPSIKSDRLRDFREPTLPTRLVRLYDGNRDHKLSATELGWTEERVRQLDKNRDALLSAGEISGMRTMPADVELRLDLSETADGAMELIHKAPGLKLSEPRAGLLRVQVEEVTLTFGYRPRDPMAEAEQAAQLVFNEIDFDANGYLDRDEIEERHRFKRYLFDAMDVDDDDRVFVKEMLAYVRSFVEPAVSSCQVTLYDVGSGYFQMIDSSDDGRISIRELRSAEQMLNQFAGGSGRTLNPSKVRHNYRIELTRGRVSLFGAVDRPAAEAPKAILRPPVGPSWFTANDTNDDGDLTWEEFIGPESTFHAMDTDRDGLIDAREASAYEAQLVSKQIPEN